jgi:hypothetical protein
VWERGSSVNGLTLARLKSALRVRVDLVFAEFLDERRAAELQEARRVRDRAVGLIERAANQLFLDRT